MLLSDTHGCIDEGILKYVKQADEVWHAGDIGNLEVTQAIESLKPLRAVYGNIDDSLICSKYPLEQVFFCEDVKVYMTHIGGYPGKYTKTVKERLTILQPQLYICGHSHILKVQYDKAFQVLHMNPGACGLSGFHQVRTMLRFTIDQGDIKELEVIEWRK